MDKEVGGASQMSGSTADFRDKYFAKLSGELNFRVNFLVRFASKTLFYWVAPWTCSQHVLLLFVRLFGFGVFFFVP